MPRTYGRADAGLALVKMAIDRESLDSLHAAIEKSILRFEERIAAARTEEHRDALVDEVCERIEEHFGLAFVAAQTFITGVTTRVARLSAVCGEEATPLSFMPAKPYLLQALGRPLPGLSPLTDIEAINAVANYWKHHEEWPTHAPDGERIWNSAKMSANQERTRKIVALLGMSASSSGNLRTAAQVLGVASDYRTLEPIRARLYTWADKLYAKARAEVEI